MTDKIEKFLNLTPMKQDIENAKYEIKQKIAEAQLYESGETRDFTEARGYILQSLEAMSTALRRLEDIADQSQNPRAYEALTAAAKALSSMSVELITLKKLDTDIDRSLQRHKTPNVINQNLFVGSTADLLDLIENKKK